MAGQGRGVAAVPSPHPAQAEAKPRIAAEPASRRFNPGLVAMDAELLAERTFHEAGRPLWVERVGDLSDFYVAPMSPGTFPRNACVFFFDGFTSGLPSYLRRCCPRKSKPSSMCVKRVAVRPNQPTSSGRNVALTNEGRCQPPSLRRYCAVRTARHARPYPDCGRGPFALRPYSHFYATSTLTLTHL